MSKYGACIYASLSYESSKRQIHASMHAHVSKGHKGLCHVTRGLGHLSPKGAKSTRAPPLEETWQLPLSLLFEVFPLSLVLLDLPPSLLQVGSSPLSYLAKKGPSLAFEVASFISLAFKAPFYFSLRLPKC